MLVDALFGYYGHTNFGDDLFSLVLTTKLGQQEWARPQSIYHGMEDTTQSSGTSRKLYNLLLLLRSRSITLGGGSVLGPARSTSLRNLQILKSRHMGVPFAAIGVGLEGKACPTRDHLLRQLDWIAVRSDAEYREISTIRKSNSTFLMPDIAYATQNVFSELKTSFKAPENRIGVIPSYAGRFGQLVSNEYKLREWLRSVLYPVIETFSVKVDIFIFQRANVMDETLARILQTKLVADGIPTELHVHSAALETFQQIGECKAVITDRLHGAIAAHAQGRDFFLSTHHRKCVEFISSVWDAHAELASDFPTTPNQLAKLLVEPQASTKLEDLLATRILAEETLDIWVEFLRRSV